MRVLLVSTYELGHQPVHVASPAAALLAAGHDVRTIDLSVQQWDAADLDWAESLAFSVPMHTAMRLAVRAAHIARERRPDLPIAFYGLYATVAHERTIGVVADHAFAGEYEPRLVAWADTLANPLAPAGGLGPVTVSIERHAFHVPARHLLPPLDRYARLAWGDELRLAAAVEASHGCAHRCRHCPVPVIFDGRVRPVGSDVVLEDIAQLVEMGARHITFADPDFLNAAPHAQRIVTGMHARFPDITFDITTKVEHILRHRDLWPALASAGCLFVVSAVESVNDDLLAILDKGHTTADTVAALQLLRAHGIEMRPSFLPFTPWSTVADVAALCAFTADHNLVANVDPVQFTIRLLLPDGSLLLDRARPFVTGYDPDALTYTWVPAHPEIDALQAELVRIVETATNEATDAAATFAAIAAACGAPIAPGAPLSSRAVPRLTEAWFCCAEPLQGQFAPLALTEKAV